MELLSHLSQGLKNDAGSSKNILTISLNGDKNLDSCFNFCQHVMCIKRLKIICHSQKH